ncbi:MAG: cytochrome ubiquinol oxidase subunit I [candidate division KSB1 bacterium]|nr:cytochrome ubiquinol oxidase subunit I [candidate division KSB1 bacterium]MDZ7304446.1 cytochrome ubiquinol oxidase subunit I [candidate division KSB1 bacterium]MDZ7310939.1 cytochrome ubiquinol oxidase subunit I [candidate division KSB1 bacterium]
MADALIMARLQFAFTVMYHYLFPQLTMGLALLIVIMKGLALWKKDERYNHGARFWAKIFAINFAVGVITGIPMEFQFGTNWAQFSTFAGGVIGQTLAMEGVFAFFLESSFLGLFLFGEKRLGQIGHFVAAVMVFLGAWISGYFIIATNAWMQHPVAYSVAADGSVHLNSFWGLLFNPWVGWQYAHNMLASVVTAAFVVSAVGAYYLLAHREVEYGKIFVRLGVISGVIASVLVAFPTGDGQVKNVVRHQPVTLAAMEGLFETKQGAELILIGQPDMEKLKIDNPIYIPRMLSFLTYRHWLAEVKGLDAFPREHWPDNIPLLYYSYHIMVGLGTIFIAIMIVANIFLLKRKLYSARWLLWILMLSFPFPYIANTTGWMAAELGRQPWLVYGLMRTMDGISPTVSAGNNLFTLIGFMGMYMVIGLLFLFLVMREVFHGPAPAVTGQK